LVHYHSGKRAGEGAMIGVDVMTMMNGLDTVDLDIMDEVFFGPPPRFLVEGHTPSNDNEPEADRFEMLGMFAGLYKIKRLMGAW
jgi:hypothetical protein